MEKTQNNKRRQEGNKTRRKGRPQQHGRKMNIEPFSAGKPLVVPPGQGPAGANLIVTGVPEAMSIKQLTFIFGRYGKLLNVYVPLDKKTRRPRGIAEVKYEKVNAARRAVDDLSLGIPLREYRMYAEPVPRNVLENGIQVKNIPEGKTEDEIRGIFQLFGDIYTMEYNQENRSAMVQYLHFDQAYKAVQMYKLQVMRVKVNNRM
jgi:RNA recognition motif-containing protein